MARTLRNKVLQVTTVSVVIGIAALYAVLSFVVMPRFDALDVAAVEQNAVRIRQAVETEASGLERILRDWAEWDATYQFVEGKEPAYLSENLDPKTFGDLRLDIFDIYDERGKLVWGRHRDLGEGPALEQSAIGSGSQGSVRTGIAKAASGPVLFAAGPILDSRGAGPAHGWLVIGRELNAAEIAALEQQTVAPIVLWPIAEAVEHGLGDPTTGAVQLDAAPTEDALHASFVLTSNGGPAAFGVTTQIVRYGHKTGRNAFEIAMGCILVLAAAEIFITAYLMELVVVRRLTELARHITRLGRSGTLAPFEGALEPDEVGRLAAEFNRLVEMLSKVRQREEEQSQAYRRAMIAAQVANDAKSRFLAHMSHELRTPLNAIIGFAEIMESEMMGPIGSATYREYAGDIGLSGHHLLSLVDDLLDLSRAESGEVSLSERVIDLRTLLDDTLRIMAQQAQRAGITLSIEMSEALRLRADPRLCRQMLLNLLGNALKFTPRDGSVHVTAERNERGETVISVIDSGIGMSAADISIALMPFGQAASDPMVQSRGVGLGIPLTKHFIEQHGGRFELSSAAGAGTRVTLIFPAERSLALSSI